MPPPPRSHALGQSTDATTGTLADSLFGRSNFKFPCIDCFPFPKKMRGSGTAGIYGCLDFLQGRVTRTALPVPSSHREAWAVFLPLDLPSACPLHPTPLTLSMGDSLHPPLCSGGEPSTALMCPRYPPSLPRCTPPQTNKNYFATAETQKKTTNNALNTTLGVSNRRFSNLGC